MLSENRNGINAPTPQDYVKFKRMLEYFVHIMRAGNKHHPEKYYVGEAKSGQGYNDDRIRASYEQYRAFSNGNEIDVTIQKGYQFYTKACYVHWLGGGNNIRVVWNDDKTDFTKLRCWENDYREAWVGKAVTIGELGLYDGETPNANLRAFYEQFAAMLSDVAA